MQSIVMGGVYSAIPYVVLAVLVVASGLATDFLRSICLSTTTVRKIFTSACTYAYNYNIIMALCSCTLV